MATELTAADRCDRCGARAVLAFKTKGAQSALLMCGHHVLLHKDQIRVVAEVIWDAQGKVLLPAS